MRRHRGGSPDSKTQGLIAQLVATFDNYVSAKVGAKTPPRTAQDFMPWLARSENPPPKLDDQLRAGFRKMRKK